jgi:hypothetical protein
LHWLKGHHNIHSVVDDNMMLLAMEIKPMIAGVAFDLYAGQFPAGEAADILALKGSVLAMWGIRGFSEPTRRKAEREKRCDKRAKKKRAPKGDPLFSCRDLFKLRLLQILPEQLGVPLAYTSEVGEDAKATPQKVAKAITKIEAAEAADTIAMTGEWMWAVARAFESGNHLHVYLYASRPNQKWSFDMHVGKLGEPPSFGWKVPHLYLPLSEIFISIYIECKKVLGSSRV